MTQQGGGNLTSFRPGQSGNPTGRPKGLVSLTKAVADVLEQPATREMVERIVPKKQAARYTDAQLAGLRNVDLVAIRAVELAIRGDVGTLQTIWSYMDGKPTEHVDVTGEVEHSVTVEAVRRAIGLAT